VNKNNKTKQFYETFISSYKTLTQEQEDFNAKKMSKNYEEICFFFLFFFKFMGKEKKTSS
jgi:hypothetical protein